MTWLHQVILIWQVKPKALWAVDESRKKADVMWTPKGNCSSPLYAHHAADVLAQFRFISLNCWCQYEVWQVPVCWSFLIKLVEQEIMTLLFSQTGLCLLYFFPFRYWQILGLSYMVVHHENIYISVRNIVLYQVNCAVSVYYFVLGDCGQYFKSMSRTVLWRYLIFTGFLPHVMKYFDLYGI